MSKDQDRTVGRIGFDQQDSPDRVVVRFHDRVAVAPEKGAERHVEKNRIGPWEELEKRFPGIHLEPSFSAIEPEKLVELQRRATEMDPAYRPTNLFAFFNVEAPPSTDLEALAKELRAWQAIERAYVDRAGPDPAVVAADDPRSANQGYLDPAPDGIDAEYAWGFVGGDGVGQRFIDLERGWTLNHEDLTAHGGSVLHGSIRDGSRSHGTSVLGEICAVDNTVGCVGIVPNVASFDCVSYWGSTRVNAVLSAIINLDFGDLLLLEAQVDTEGPTTLYGPIEVLDAEFEAIRLATALGVIVVEAGGNGTNNGMAPGLDMDTYVNASGELILFRDAGNPDFRDSGAIIVSAATSAAPHTRRTYGPFGERIDCYAWSQNIDTTASTSAGSTTAYTTGFSGTSGASPIISGAALSLQGIAEATLGMRFGPYQMRALLSDPATGTPPAVTETTAIGVMPDLRAIIDGSVLNLAPDIYVRDNLADVGDPHSGSISASPDVILRPSPVANPQASFGEGSGTENDQMLGFEAEAGQDNQIYVRVRNRGGSSAVDVRCTVYWSPVATLVTPNLWTLVGETVIPNVPTGDQLTVSDAIVWPEAALPGPGHYCLVGIVGNAEDPQPNPADFLDWDNFRNFIRINNNVTWRNFNVVDNVPDPDSDDPVALEFLAPGAPDRARPMALEVVARLPKGAKAWIEMPLYLVDALRLHNPAIQVDKRCERAQLPINPHGRMRLGEYLFPAKSRTRMTLHVWLPKEHRKSTYEVFARQLFEGEELGRVTWRLVPFGRKPKDEC